MAPTLQAKLLRALQEGEIRRVGGERAIKVRPRVIAATNRDLRAASPTAAFREDLYFRLAAFVISLPPLRERPEDIPALVHEFLRRSSERLKKDVKTVTPQAMTALVNYGWPGNVRELEHAIERAVILARTTALRLEDLPHEITSDGGAARGHTVGPRSAGHRAGAGGRGAAALRREPQAGRTALGVSTVTLWRMLKRHGLDAK